MKIRLFDLPSSSPLKAFAFIAAMAFAIAFVPSVHADDELAYRRQFQALEPSDIDGHMNLAKWCREQKAWELLEKQCNYVLRLDADHAMATVYLELAKSYLGNNGTNTPASTDPQASNNGVPRKRGEPIRELTNDEIRILRRHELLLNQPERVPVEFKNKVLDRFWNYLALRENLVPKDRAGFNRLRPAVRKAQFILSKVEEWERASTEEEPYDDEFSADIIIEDDPAIFREFKSPKVSGVILNSCATARCHGGRDAGEFVLYNERIMNDKLHYANYMALNEYEKDGERLVNRDDPPSSLILIFGQPKTTGPDTAHPTPVGVVFNSPQNPKYRNLLAWLVSLGVTQPDYGFTLADPLPTNKGSRP